MIITSATIDTVAFSKAFNDAPIIEVSGRTFPVDVEYRPPGVKRLRRIRPTPISSMRLPVSVSASSSRRVSGMCSFFCRVSGIFGNVRI